MFIRYRMERQRHRIYSLYLKYFLCLYLYPLKAEWPSLPFRARWWVEKSLTWELPVIFSQLLVETSWPAFCRLSEKSPPTEVIMVCLSTNRAQHISHSWLWEEDLCHLKHPGPLSFCHSETSSPVADILWPTSPRQQIKKCIFIKINQRPIKDKDRPSTKTNKRSIFQK